MIYFANPNTQSVVNAMAAGEIGMIDTPYQGGMWVTQGHARGVAWCADNGAFTAKWTAERWWTWLQHPQQLDHVAECLFATAPDVVGDWRATEALARPWLPRIRRLGYPVAYVAQNGMEDSTYDLWDDIDALFIGGTWECRYHGARLDPRKNEGRGMHLRAWCDQCGEPVHEWKLSEPAVELAHVAGSLGKWVHVGRVNSGKRIRWAAAFADSSDGTFLTRGPDKNLARMRRWLQHHDPQPSLFGGNQ